jgi:hypothetical protein
VVEVARTLLIRLRCADGLVVVLLCILQPGEPPRVRSLLPSLVDVPVAVRQPPAVVVAALRGAVAVILGRGWEAAAVPGAAGLKGGPGARLSLLLLPLQYAGGQRYVRLPSR